MKNKILTPKPNEKENEVNNQIIETTEKENEIIEKNDNNMNKINDQKKKKIPDIKSKDYILYLEGEKDNKYCLNMFFDSSHYYFKLSKKETIDVSFVYHYNHFYYSTLLLKLKLDGEKYIDFKSIEAILIECLNKNNVILKKGNGESMKIIFKLMNNAGEINLNKENMTEEQKFEKVLNEIKDLKNW